jgi:hypothetical protein
MNLRVYVSTYENRRFVTRTHVVDVDLPEGGYLRLLEVYAVNGRPPARPVESPVPVDRTSLVASVPFSPSKGCWLWIPPPAVDDD